MAYNLLKLMRDPDGDLYLVPEHMTNEFHEWIRTIEASQLWEGYEFGEMQIREMPRAYRNNIPPCERWNRVF